MSKANTGKGKGVETQPRGGEQGKKNAKAADRTADNAGAQRGGRGGAAAAGGKGGQQQGQQQQGQQRPGGKGGAGPNDQKGAATKVPDYLSNYPRLNLDSENKKLDDYTKQIDAAYEQMDEIRKRIEVIQEERKAIQSKELESRDARSEQSLVRDKLVSERNTLRKKIEQLVGARKRKLEELNRMKRQLPINKDIKDSAKVVALNLEFLDKEERIVEQKIKSAVSALQDRSSSKELSGITAKRRQVKEWAKFAQEAEAPIDPTLEARLKELDEEIKKLNEGDREVKGDYMRLKEALQAKGDELGAAKLERSAIAQKIETLKKDRDAVYAVIRDKRKEHNNKVRDLQRADREKKAQLDKERRIKQKKEQRAKALQELAQAYKEELAMCDRLSALLINRQAKQQKKASGEEAHEEAAPEQQEEEQKKDEEDEDEEEHNANGDDEDEEASTTATGTRRTRFQFTNATHIDFEFLSVQPPASLEEIPAALDSIARKKAFYERLAAEKEEERKRIEAQYDAELQAMETGSAPKKAPAAKKATENGTGAAKKPAAKKANKKDDAAAAATKEEGEEEEQANAEEAESPAESNGDADAPADDHDEEEASPEATEDGDE